MLIVRQIHGIFGEMVLPVLILLAAIYLTATYKADAPRNPVTRIFPVLVDLQVALGIIYWVFVLITGDAAFRAHYLGFPFIMHPILGLLAAGLAHMAVGKGNPLRSLGRWAPMASLVVLLVLIVSNAMIARIA